MTYYIGSLILFTIIVATTGYISERVQWNKGVCRKNGIKWKHFDVDSQGGNGYTADDEVVWISYPFITKRRGG